MSGVFQIPLDFLFRPTPPLLRCGYPSFSLPLALTPPLPDRDTETRRKQGRKRGQSGPGPQKDGLPPSQRGGWHAVHSAVVDWPLMRSATGGGKKKTPPAHARDESKSKLGMNLMRTAVRHRFYKVRWIHSGPTCKQKKKCTGLWFGGNGGWGYHRV